MLAIGDWQSCPPKGSSSSSAPRLFQHSSNINVRFHFWSQFLKLFPPTVGSPTLAVLDFLARSAEVPSFPGFPCPLFAMVGGWRNGSHGSGSLQHGSDGFRFQFSSSSVPVLSRRPMAGFKKFWPKKYRLTFSLLRTIALSWLFLTQY